MKKKMLVAALMLIVMMTQISAFASSYATYAVHNEKAVLKAADKSRRICGNTKGT